MEHFLQGCKAALQNEHEGLDFHVVLGNEACDLDSMVSALSLAYYLAKTSSSTNLVFVPVLNIPREDFPLRTESTFFLKEIGISKEHLTFRDEIDLGDLYESGRLVLSLVDHSVLPRADSFMEDVVTEVIDHHVTERKTALNCRVTIELVGSCSTLIAEKIFRDAPHILDFQLASLLRGPIVLDCVNMTPAAGRVTPKDTEHVTILESKFPHLTPRGALFDSMMKAKIDVSGLSTDQMLRKDLKALLGRNVTLAIAAIYIELETFLRREGMESDLRAFCRRHGYHALIAMPVTFTSSNVPVRQLAVYSQQGELLQLVSKALEQATNPSLELSRIPFDSKHITAYNQGNAVASRKKVLPILKDFLKKRSLNESGARPMHSFQEAEDYKGQLGFNEQNVVDNLEGNGLLDDFGEQQDNPDACVGDEWKYKGYPTCFRKQTEDGLDDEKSFPPTPMNSLVEGCPLDRGLPKLTAEAILERINRITVVDSEVKSTGSQ
ncbi:exopolyphosphatase PRUNE1 isoform X2 [Mixophyes fleayi]|uniref:exopolyphosphatase PRUNE1 isoform X2 n=1 Tax=Mixophyes fleayi TaxID=3061075 RepID=UPI003F4D9FE1